MKIKKNSYYSINYPMNTYQKQAHADALHRTVQYFKEEKNMGVTQAQIIQVLKIVHYYIMHLTVKMRRRTEKGYASVSKVHFGYFRTIFPKLFTDMYNNGEFTKEEFNIIRNEFYKKEFDVYTKITRNGKTTKVPRG